MALTKDLERRLEQRLSSLEAKLQASNHSAEERDVLLTGLREHIHEQANLDIGMSVPEFEQRLDDLIGDLDIEMPAPNAAAESDTRFLGYAALLLSIGVSASIAIGAPVAAYLGADGGAVMILIALFGYPLALVFSWMSRKSSIGRIALTITLLGIFLLAALITWAFLFPEDASIS